MANDNIGLICTSEVCCLSDEKRKIGPCKFCVITKDDKEDCCPY